MGIQPKLGGVVKIRLNFSKKDSVDLKTTKHLPPASKHRSLLI